MAMPGDAAADGPASGGNSASLLLAELAGAAMGDGAAREGKDGGCVLRVAGLALADGRAAVIAGVAVATGKGVMLGAELGASLGCGVVRTTGASGSTGP